MKRRIQRTTLPQNHDISAMVAAEFQKAAAEVLQKLIAAGVLTMADSEASAEFLVAQAQGRAIESSSAVN